MSKSISFLPSVVRLESGESLYLSDLRAESRSEIIADMCNTAGQKISNYFSQSPDEWRAFVKTINTSK